MKKIRLGVLGLGRIGQMHIENIFSMPEFTIVRGADPYLTPERKALFQKKGVPIISEDPDEVFRDPDIDAVLITSATSTHADFIVKAAKAGKDIFCEKPIAHKVPDILKAIRSARDAGVVLQVGFMRRFDKHNHALAEMVHEGKIGELEVLKITDRDPAPPSMDYIRTSGGIFIDFMIHDFDMARYITQSEAAEVFATGTTVIDKEIQKEGDFGSGHAIIKFENGAIAVLESTRRATFGEDQRMEALGSKGLIMNDNVCNNNVRFFNETGAHSSRFPWHFQERYKDAYFEELKAFANAVQNRKEAPVNGQDGLQAVLIAEAAARSAKSGKMETVEKVEI